MVVGHEGPGDDEEEEEENKRDIYTVSEERMLLVPGMVVMVRVEGRHRMERN